MSIHEMGAALPTARLRWDSRALAGRLWGAPSPLPTHPGAPLPADEKGSDAAPGDTASPRWGAFGPGGLWGPAAAEADEVDSNENEAQAQAQACQGCHQQQGLGKGET